MAKTAYTPGPWTHKRTHQMSEDTWYVIVDFNGRGPIIDIGGKDNRGQIGEAKYLITDAEEIEANARLMAAAPEMLEALEYIFLSGQPLLTKSGIDRIKNAIEKARGGFE